MSLSRASLLVMTSVLASRNASSISFCFSWDSSSHKPAGAEAGAEAEAEAEAEAGAEAEAFELDDVAAMIIAE